MKDTPQQINVLIIGGGGREHAIAWKVRQSPRVAEVFAAPGSEGMRDVATVVPIAAIDQDALVAFARQHDVGLTIVGPEVPLLAGIVDRFQSEGLTVFGPTQAAAALEGSKDFAKRLMARHGIPTASSCTFTEYEQAAAFVRQHGAPIVIKADGLAAGKGVVVAMHEQEALEALAQMLQQRAFGDAGARVVVEEYLEGEELSLMCLVHGRQVVPLATAQDHKRIGEGDTGPNTGGMGAYSPVPQFDQAALDEALDDIVHPMVEAMADEGTPFTGVLYAGLMMTAQGPKVIEFNVRFGDPETQVVLPRLESDLVAAILALLDHRTPVLNWSDDAVVGVVLASRGYPNTYATGVPINGLPQAVERGGMVFHAGTAHDHDGWRTAGGRVLLVAGRGDSLREAQANAYHAVDAIGCDALYCRQDIAHRAL